MDGGGSGVALTKLARRLFLLLALLGGACARAAEIRGVYPSADQLPENLARFHLYFSAPMPAAEAPARVHLVDTRGNTVPVSLSPAEGLETHFVVAIRAGSLHAGTRYSITVDQAWTDTSGTPLPQAFRKEFRATTADRSAPNPKHWKLALPDPDTDDTLTVDLDEALDYFLAGRFLTLVGPQGPVSGHPELTKEETRWVFEPGGPWLAGTYRLLVGRAITDLADNRVAGAAPGATISVSFRIR